MLNHFIGESFSYDDIETTNDPNVLYRLNVRDQYMISAVSISDVDIKLIITNQEGRPVNMNGDLLPYEQPYVVLSVSGDADNRDQVIKSQMLRIADDLLYNITEEVSVVPKKYLDVDELMNTDPFGRGWSTNPYDAVEALKDLGYIDVDMQGDYITFSDASDREYYFYVNRVGQNTFQYTWGGSSEPEYGDDADDYLQDTDDDYDDDDDPSPALPYDADDEEYEDYEESVTINEVDDGHEKADIKVLPRWNDLLNLEIDHIRYIPSNPRPYEWVEQLKYSDNLYVPVVHSSYKTYDDIPDKIKDLPVYTFERE